jgi:hypothetical protein
MIAIGELQEEMGPDMRVSCESAILDQNPSTTAIDGLEQSRWMASYHSWGNWLNDDYTPPGSTEELAIQDTYTRGREPMFRKWLLSLPDDMKRDINAPASISDWGDSNSVIMVGEGTLGPAATTNPDRITRAYLLEVNDSGRFAWWITPENHKAKANLAMQSRNLSLDKWEISSGTTAEVAVSSLSGFSSLDENPEEAERLYSQNSIELLTDIEKLIEDKLQKEEEKVVREWPELKISIEKARWGRHTILQGKTKIELAKDVDVQTITLEQVQAMLDTKKGKSATSKGKTATVKKTTKKK